MKLLTTKEQIAYWKKNVNSYLDGGSNSWDNVLASNSELATLNQNMKNAESSYSRLISGGFSGYAKSTGITDYTGRLNNLLSQIIHSKFNYDAKNDATYSAYKDQYRNSGRLARENAVGAGAANTGGYANSYAQTAGNTANQQQIDALSGVQAQLLSLAEQKYQQGLNTKQNMFDTYNTQQNQNMQRYQDAINNSFNTLQYNTGRYDTAYGNAYNKWSTDMNTAMAMYNHYTDARQQELSREQQKRISDRDYELRKRGL